MSETRTAIVTGGSRGIGRAIAVALGTQNYQVVINYAANIAAAEETRSQVQAAGGRGLIVRADISLADNRQALVDQTLEAFGTIDLLVNNAGIAPKVRADLLEMPEGSYDDVMDTNLKGPFLLTQHVARHMIQHQANGKTIVNIGSISAYTASVSRAEYCLAKAGMGMMTKLFAARLAEHGINVYEVRPGVIATDMTGPVKAKYDKLILEDERGITPIRRWGQPEDIAQAVVALAGGQFPFSTGEVINVDGGFHLRTL